MNGIMGIANAQRTLDYIRYVALVVVLVLILMALFVASLPSLSLSLSTRTLFRSLVLSTKRWLVLSARTRSVSCE